MQNDNERERGTVRVAVDRFKINNHEAARAAVDGLTAAGFDVDIVPGFEIGVLGNPEPQGDIVTVYRKER